MNKEKFEVVIDFSVTKLWENGQREKVVNRTFLDWETLDAFLNSANLEKLLLLKGVIDGK